MICLTYWYLGIKCWHGKQRWRLPCKLLKRVIICIPKISFIAIWRVKTFWYVNQSIIYLCIIIIIILSIFLPFSYGYSQLFVVPITQLITFIFPPYYYNILLWSFVSYQIGDNYKVKLCDLGLATVTEQKKRMTVCGTNVRVHSINNNNNPIVS